MVEGIKMLTIGTTSLIAGQSCSCQVGNIPSLWLTILPRVAFLPSSVRQWLPASDLWDCSGNPIPSGQSWRLSSWTLDVYDVLVCVFFRKRNYEERHVLYLLNSSKSIPSKNLQQRYRLQGLGGQVFEFGTSISSYIWRGRRHYPKYCRWGHFKLRSLRVQNCEWCLMMFFPWVAGFFRGFMDVFPPNFGNSETRQVKVCWTWWFAHGRACIVAYNQICHLAPWEMLPPALPAWKHARSVKNLWLLWRLIPWLV